MDLDQPSGEVFPSTTEKPKSQQSKKTKSNPSVDSTPKSSFTSSSFDDWGTPSSDSWGNSNSDDWGTPSSDSWGAEPSSSQSDALSSLDDLLKIRELTLESKNASQPTQKKKKQTKPKPNTNVPPERYGEWIEVEIETAGSITSLNEEVSLELSGSSDNETADWTNEGYEKIKLYDEYFGKFMKSIQQNPEQILRYDYSGKPLWIRQTHEDITNCQYCGSSRVFEFQIMSHGLNWIIEHSLTNLKAKNNLVECGSVFVFSCAKSCLPSDLHVWAVEQVIIQQSV
jgi:pre-rRNA-processing protein TSR4